MTYVDFIDQADSLVKDIQSNKNKVMSIKRRVDRSGRQQKLSNINRLVDKASKVFYKRLREKLHA
jgi:hypothetical protein